MPTSTACTPAPEDGRRPRDLPGLDRTILGLIARAGRDPGLTPPNKAVLLAVVAHADGNGVCKATDQTLARDSRTSVPTVQRALKLFQGQRVIERAYEPPDVRAIRLLPGEQSPVVDVVVDLESIPDRERKQQQQTIARECSPAINPNTAGEPAPEGDPDHGVESLVALLTARKVTARVARKLVEDFPERIVPQVEAHGHRNVLNPAASLVTAIREDWPTDPPIAQEQPTARGKAEAARKAAEAKRQAAHDVQARHNARLRAEAEQVEAFWEGLSEDDQAAFVEEAIEASLRREEIRSHGPDSPIYTLLRLAARREHVRRKLGLPPEADA